MPLRQTVLPYTGLAYLYDALMGNHFYSHLRFAFEQLVRRYGIRAASAADIACGTGQFVHYLKNRRLQAVFGVDRSPAMLAVALARNRGNHARFLCQDFAALHLPRPVDLITCNFDSLNYLLHSSQLQETFKRFCANLVTGGHVIFDMVTDHPWWHGTQPYLEQVIRPDLRFVRTSYWDAHRCRQTAIFNITHGGRTTQEVHVQRGYPVTLVVTLLALAGLTPLGVHDFYTLNRPGAAASRVVYVSRKGKEGREPWPATLHTL